MKPNLFSILPFLSVFFLFSLQGKETGKWESLFNGKDLSQFKGYKKDKPGNAWVAEDGAVKLIKAK